MKYLILVFFVFLGCTKESPKDVSPVIPVVSDESTKPISGWLPAYDEFIKDSVKTKDSLLNIPDSRMIGFCPNWPRMAAQDRVQFWADLFYSITKPESNYNRTSMYWEEAQGTDEVTGLSVKTSEGLLQLSYSDVRTYRGKCKFDYAADKQMHIDDINNKPSSHSWKSRHPEKTILDPYLNLGCGVEIADAMFDLSSWYNVGYPKQRLKSFDALMGSYWSTMRVANSTFQEVKSQMKSRSSKCYQSN
jgi:hypothetical protein